MQVTQTLSLSRRVRLLKITAILVLSISASVLSAGTFSLEYSFNSPEIAPVTIADQIYHSIVMNACPNGGEIGCPALPYRGAKILIPYGQKVVNIEIIAAPKIVLGEGYLLEPVTAPIPLSVKTEDRLLPILRQEIYNLDSPYPDVRFEKTGQYSFRGYDILVLKLSPVEYIPLSGQISYYPRLQVIVNTIADNKDYSTYRGLTKDEFAVGKMVDNSTEVISYPTAEKSSSDSYDLLIMTVPWLVDAFQPLKAFHDSTGVPTEIFTIVDVLNEVGNDIPDDIREFIKLKYLQDGISYVLIGDDNSLIPTKTLYVEIEGSSPDDSSIVEFGMPSDFFFGCLDGPFDYDGDGQAGEPNDGEGGGDVDLFAELYIGRASVDDETEAARFVEKTIRYLTSESDYKKDVLICGEKTYFPGLMRFGKQSLIELVDGTDLHGYSTVGIPSDLYNINWLCDMDGTWDPQELIDLINGGTHFINHLGHNHYQVALKLWFYHLEQLTNSDLTMVYSQGCYAGGFDTLDCWAEYITTKTDHGAFAAIMNARYGLGSYNDSDSPSQRYNREFWDAVFNPAEEKTEIGRANQDSKEDNVYRINEGGMRWIYYGLNLFGDPTVNLKRFPGLVFSYPDGIPSLSAVGQPISFEVALTGIYGGVPVAGSGQLHYSINGGDLVVLSMTETSPDHYLATLPGIDCGDTLSFHVSAEESVTGRLNDPHDNTTFSLIPIVRTITAFEDDFETDKGWTTTDDMWQRGIPTGSGGEYGLPDPVSGCVGVNVYGYCLDGDYENGLSEKYLISPPVDCTHLDNVHLFFERWLGVGHPPGDCASVAVSYDGIEWTTIWQNPGLMQDSSWIAMDFDVTEMAAFQSSVYFRWTMGPTDETWRYCGWNIDDVRVVSYDCRGYYCGDANGDDLVNIGDAVYLVSHVFGGGPAPQPPEAGDANADGGINVGDAVYLINYIFKGGPRPQCP